MVGGGWEVGSILRRLHRILLGYKHSEIYILSFLMLVCYVM